MTSTLASAVASTLRYVDASTPQSSRLPFPGETADEPLPTSVSEPEVSSRAAPVTRSSDPDDQRPSTVDATRKASASISLPSSTAFTKTRCSVTAVDGSRDSTSSVTSDCGGTSSGHSAEPSPPHAADPISEILKSFFGISHGDEPALPSLVPGRRKSPQQPTSNSKLARPTPPAEATEDKPEFLWSGFDNVLSLDRRRSAREGIADDAPTSDCAGDGVLASDCGGVAMTPTDNSTVNETRHGDDGFTAGELASMIAVGVVLGGICLATVVGNALVLVAIVSNGHLRGTTHYFIANLAVADLLLGLAVLPFSTALETIDRWVFGETFCDVWAALDVVCDLLNVH